jgi:dUTP pyrophosphatase
MDIKIVNRSIYPLPQYATAGSSGMDLRANMNESITLAPMERVLVPTGLFIELPVGYEAQIRPRSGLAMKMGITCLNTPGTIDADYRGEIKVLLINMDQQPQVILPGERIAQLVIQRVEKINWLSVDELGNSERNEGGFGSTGRH